MVWCSQAQAITWVNVDSDLVGANRFASSDEIDNFQNVSCSNLKGADLMKYAM